MTRGKTGRFAFPAAVAFFIASATFLLYVVLGIILGNGFPRLFPDIGSIFFSEKTETASAALLEGTRDLFRLDTVEYVYRTVFPYDFYDPDLDGEELLRRTRGLKDLRTLVLSAAEYDFLAARALAERIGIGPTKNPEGFVIVTVVVKAGYSRGENGVDGLAFELPEDGKGRTVAVRMPSPAITDLVVEDPETGLYEFPDVRITPERWKELTAFVTERVRSRVLTEGILRDAETAGREAVRRFLAQAGFTDVTLSEPYYP